MLAAFRLFTCGRPAAETPDNIHHIGTLQSQPPKKKKPIFGAEKKNRGGFFFLTQFFI